LEIFHSICFIPMLEAQNSPAYCKPLFLIPTSISKLSSLD